MNLDKLEALAWIQRAELEMRIAGQVIAVVDDPMATIAVLRRSIEFATAALKSLPTFKPAGGR
jgi:hypothetical protein